MIDFGKLIDRHLERGMRPKDIGRYYPSEVGSCLRKVWFSYKNPKEMDPETVRIFKVGNMLHDFVSEVLRSEKNPDIKLVQSEAPFKLEARDFTISGRVDDVILVEKSGERVLVEVKTTKMVSMTKEASQPHLMQLQLYMHALNIHKGIVLYIEKNSLQTKEFDVEYQPEKYAMIIERFNRLHKHLKSGALPAPEAKDDPSMKWMCGYCEYKEECKQAEKGTKAESEGSDAQKPEQPAARENDPETSHRAVKKPGSGRGLSKFM
jgi:CRISPR/Cas system-associated exonuclease Cas4 (RecB family)